HAVSAVLCHFVVDPGIRVYFVDGGSRNNVVELMQQHALPAVVQLLLRVLAAQNVCHGGEPLDLRQLVLHMAVGFLIICLRGIGSSVILQIQLSVPGMHVTVCVVHILVHLAEEFSGSSRLYIGQSRQLVHSPAQLQHLSGNTAAAVSVSVGDQGI